MKPFPCVFFSTEDLELSPHGILFFHKPEVRRFFSAKKRGLFRPAFRLRSRSFFEGDGENVPRAYPVFDQTPLADQDGDRARFLPRPGSAAAYFYIYNKTPASGQQPEAGVLLLS